MSDGGEWMSRQQMRGSIAHQSVYEGRLEVKREDTPGGAYTLRPEPDREIQVDLISLDGSPVELSKGSTLVLQHSGRKRITTVRTTDRALAYIETAGGGSEPETRTTPFRVFVEDEDGHPEFPSTWCITEDETGSPEYIERALMAYESLEPGEKFAHYGEVDVAPDGRIVEIRLTPDDRERTDLD